MNIARKKIHAPSQTADSSPMLEKILTGLAAIVRDLPTVHSVDVQTLK